MPQATPSDDAYRRVSEVSDAEQFQTCFMDWIQTVEWLAEGHLVTIDGKALRRSHDRSHGKKALQMVSARASANRVVLGRRKVDGASNEIAASPEADIGASKTRCIGC